ncbi:MAG TPA: sigma-70 family RNA polymerase sigma factor [Methylomirabilota bacterium]|jgi:RNA polymerase sigma-70 factor (ECF subfamily)|nr:sigma-70 family RNA polymerase sigma factor [Methylomirabilota bacterium]
MTSHRSPDSEAFEQMVKPHLSYLYGLALRLSANATEAEDLVQEALLKAFRAFPGLRNRERPRLWLTRVITSCHYDRVRAGQPGRQTVSLDDETNFDLFDKIVDEDPFPYSDRVHLDFIELFDDARIVEVLRGLHPEYRAAVILAYVYGYTAREISEITASPQGTVLARLSRGRRQLERGLWDYAVEHRLIPRAEVRA